MEEKTSLTEADPSVFPFSDLPEDLQLQICLFIHGSDVLALGMTCSTSRELCRRPALWLGMILAQFGEKGADGVAHNDYHALRRRYFDLAAYKKPARELSIAWGDTPHYWSHRPIDGNEFSPCAVLRSVCWLDVSADFSSVQPGTYCAQFRVMLPPQGVFGFASRTEMRVEVDGRLESVNYVDAHGFPRLARLHLGEWFDLGVATFTLTQPSNVKVSIVNHSGDWKTGLAIDYARLRLVRPAGYSRRAIARDEAPAPSVLRPFMSSLSAMAKRFMGDGP